MKEIAALVGVLTLASGFLGSAPAQAGPGGDQAQLGTPFVGNAGQYLGHWGAHGESVTVNGDGTGQESYAGGPVFFKMSSISTDKPITAFGNVTGGSKETGSFVTMVLVDGGNGMLFSVGGGDTNFPFCKRGNSGNYLNPADCGA